MPQSKAVRSSSNALAPERSTFGHRLGHDTLGQVRFLQRTLGNQATQRVVSQWTKDETRSAAKADGAPAPLRTQGHPLDAATRAHFEGSFGFDFSRVRIHIDAAAAQSALALNANAYTVGKDVVFAAGQFAPRTPDGRRLLSHELAHVVQQAGGGAPPGQAQEQDADAAARAVETDRQPQVRAPSGVGLAAQLGQSSPSGPIGDPLRRYREAGVAFTTHQEIEKEVAEIMNAPGGARATGRADFKSNPAGAKITLDHSHFPDNRERLSYAYGVFEEELIAQSQSGEAADRDVLFTMLVNYEISRIPSSRLIVHEKPTEREVPRLEQARSTRQAEQAQQWEAGAQRARNLTDVTPLATPARRNPDPFFTESEPRRPMHGSVQGYLFEGGAFAPRDLLPKQEFQIYATDWERAHSGVLVAGGLSPVVGSTSTGVAVIQGWSPSPDYPLLGYIGYVTADSIYVPEAVPGLTVPSEAAQTVETVLASGLPAFVFTKIGKAIEEQTGYGGASFLVSTDRNGRLLNIWGETRKSEPPIESVASPIDFFGPKLVTSAGRALAGVAGEAASLAGEAASLAGEASAAIRGSLSAVGRKGALSLGFAMKGAADLPFLTLEETPAAFVIRQEAQATAGAAAGEVIGQEAQAAAGARGGEIVTNTSSPLTPGPHVFGEIHRELGWETPGTITYPTVGAAAAGARAAGLHTATRLGFQTHSTARIVRRVLGRSGNQWQSVHMLFQAAYRALRARGYIPPGGQLYSPGRALTTLDLPLAAHRAFDAGWVPLWNAAVASGQTITAGQVYQWLSNAINAMNPTLISPAVQGVLLMRIRSELFVELGLNWNDPIVP
jgi:hypothetical protein